MACAFDMSHCLTKEIIVKLSRFFRHDKRLFQRKLMINVKYRKKKFHKKKDFGCVTAKFTWSSARKSNHLRGTANNGSFPLCIVLHNLHNQITWKNTQYEEFYPVYNRKAYLLHPSIFPLQHATMHEKCCLRFHRHQLNCIQYLCQRNSCLAVNSRLTRKSLKPHIHLS